MRRFAWLAVAAIGLAGCNFTQTPTPGPAPQAHYESVVIQGSKTAADWLVKIYVPTGVTMMHCCSESNSVFSPVAETAAPPAGEYHLRAWSDMLPDGSVSWNLYRFDNVSGRAWVLAGDGATGWRWQEINQTAPTAPH